MDEDRIRRMNEELAESQVPVQDRCFQAWRGLAEQGAQVEHEVVAEWYRREYGAKSVPVFDVGHVPILLSGDVFSLRVPLVHGRIGLDAVQYIEGLTEQKRRSLTEGKVREILRCFEDACALLYQIEDLRGWMDPPGNFVTLSSDARTMIEVALMDLRAAMGILEDAVPPLHLVCWQSQQHAEKMLKGFLITKGRTPDDLRKRFSHRIADLHAECQARSARFAEVAPDIVLLAKVHPDVRYTTIDDRRTGVETFWSAMRVGGLCACEISGQQRRYKGRIP
ncbi:MAG: HEPN domain-containing protein [Spirochaetales bacterium]|nr:HEPN domain-containing protein [Spirochaetales bacterium]